MLDYSEVKKVFADKLANDSDGIGRFESAFYHTMKMVYLHGVEDGETAARHTDEARDRIVGVTG
jgi:hypothetical protein